jgi:1-aminocyclopropane-1-carboxylate deaminase/D-cysteine desulfhydrase-like pyridoxal-dependent ACC family enzyme
MRLVHPTPLVRADAVSRATGCDVWVKRDDLTHPRYGGNKVRKLERLLADALAHGATDVVTMGAAGSHHCLATALHGAAAGLRVEVVLMPQPTTPHVVETLRALVASGAVIHPVRSAVAMPLQALARVATLRARGRRPYLIPVGGSTPEGTRGYLDAVAELRAQGGDGFDAIVCALGSGGTHAGLVAGAALHGVAAGVWGVRVTPLTGARALVWGLANAALSGGARVPWAAVRVRDDQLGGGYGVATRAGDEATRAFAEDGVTLDATYTAKAAAGLLAMARERRGQRLLYWHTLSSAPMEPLLVGAPEGVPRGLEGLILPG